MRERTLRILILDDSPADAELVRRELERAGKLVITERVDSRAAFARALDAFVPDVILSDHGLTDFTAIDALQQVRAVRPTVPLIMVVGALDERTFVTALRAGAEDFVLKHSLSRLSEVLELALAVRRPLRMLSPRQIEVLRLVTQGHTTRDIARHLGISVKTVETHRAELMRRLGIHEVAGLVRYAVRVGLVPPEAVQRL
jgi:DNA-binding NarL/FixJ family response regulator